MTNISVHLNKDMTKAILQDGQKLRFYMIVKIEHLQRFVNPVRCSDIDPDLAFEICHWQEVPEPWAQKWFINEFM